MQFEMGLDENDKDILVFVGMDSESDNLPLCTERIYLSVETLKYKENEINSSEEWALDFGIEAC